MPFIIVEVSYTEGLQGRNLLVMRTGDGSVIADLMMGRDGLNPQAAIDEMVLSALSEAMNQMMGSAATSLSSMFNRIIAISPPVTRVIDLGSEPLDQHLDSDEYLAKIAFSMTVEDLIDSEIMLLLQVDFAREMVDILLHQQDLVADPAEPETQTAVAPPSYQPEVQTAVREPLATPPETVRHRPERAATPPITVQPVEFQPFPPESTVTQPGTDNLQLLMDVPLQLTVELGRTQKTIREVLDFVPGSIFELDRVAGEPVDIFVNGKLIAKGEVVVIDENFGVRITDVVSVIDRVSHLQ